MDTDLARVFAFERTLLRGAADHTKVLPWGEAILTPDLPLVYELNMIVVDQPVADASMVLDAVEELLAGYDHRKLRVEDAAAAATLRPVVVAAGWTEEEHVAMVLRPVEAEPASAAVVEVDIDTYRAADATFLAEEPWGSPAVAEQFAARFDRYARVVSLRCFAVHSEGRIVAGAQLLSRDGVAEVDGVHVLAEHRGRGWGRAVTSAAVAAAREGGCELVFLLADAEDWPLQVYGRMGFEAVGSVALFQRTSAQ